MNLQSISEIACSFQEKFLPDCRKTFLTVQERLRADKCKLSLDSITFQNKVALRRSLKNGSSPLGACVNTALDFKTLPQDYNGPFLAEGTLMDDDFLYSLRDWYSKGGILPQQILYRVLQQAEMGLRTIQSSLQEVELDEDQCIHVCGDIHGQFKDLLNIFFLKGNPSRENLYLFNGDIVDRGPASIPCIVYLLALRTVHPEQVFINRGNHEAVAMNLKDGFYTEIMTSYNDSFIFDLFQELFSLLVAATLISSKVLVLHGGLSSVRDFNLEDIRRLPRGLGLQPEDSDVLCDILWSDPMVIGDGIAVNKRGGGILFGSDITSRFLSRNNLQCLVRSHTEIQEGCICMHPGCYTVFSAPNKAKGVLGGVLTVHPTETENLRLEGFVFQQTE